MRLRRRPIATLISASIVISPFVAIADDSADIAIIRNAGTPTPFSGVLMSNLAYSKMMADREVAKERADDTLKLELGLLDARLRLATATTTNDLAATKKFDAIRFDIKDKRIVQLENQLVEADKVSHGTDWEKVIWFGIGVGSVIAGALAVKWVSSVGN